MEKLEDYERKKIFNMQKQLKFTFNEDFSKIYSMIKSISKKFKCNEIPYDLFDKIANKINIIPEKNIINEIRNFDRKFEQVIIMLIIMYII